MRMMALALLGTVLAGACQPAAKDGMPLAERRLAEKLLASGLLIPTGEEGMRQLATQQAQQAMMSGALLPDQFVQAAMAIERNMKPVMAEVHESAVKGLVDSYNVKELELLVEFFASKRGEAVRENISTALAPSQELMGGRAQEAVAKAIEQVRSAWPEAGPAPTEAPMVPGAPVAPPSN